MGLPPKRPMPALEALDQHHLPQRPCPVERTRKELGSPIAQLPVVARRRQLGTADVVANVEALIGHPLRPRQAPRPSARQPLRVARKLTQPCGQMLPHGLDSRSHPARRRIEHHHPADAHQRPLVQLLEPEERPVERRQRVRHALNLGSGAVAVIGAEQRFTSVVPPDGYLGSGTSPDALLLGAPGFAGTGA